MVRIKPARKKENLQRKRGHHREERSEREKDGQQKVWRQAGQFVQSRQDRKRQERRNIWRQAVRTFKHDRHALVLGPIRVIFKWMRRATLADWCWLARFQELRQRIYLYDDASRSVRHPDSSSGVPWPTIWLLARHHRKFMFASGMRPNSRGVRSGLAAFDHATRRTWFFRDSTDMMSLFSIVHRGFNTPFSFPSPPELSAWLGGLKRVINSAVGSAASCCANSKFPNMLPLDRLALLVLRNHQWAAVPSDKDGGFAI